VKEKADSVEQVMVLSFWRSCSEYVRSVAEWDFIRNVAGTFTTRVLLLGIGFATSVIVARILGPEGRGAYAVAVAIGAIGVQMSNLGLHASNTYTVARKPELLSTLVINSAAVGIGLGGIAAVLMGLLFSLRPTLAPLQGPLLWLSLCWIPFGLCYLFLQNLLLGIDEVKAYNKLELASKIISVVLICSVILFGIVSAESVFVTGLLTLGCSLVWAFVTLKKHAFRLTRPSFALLRENFGYSIRGYVAALFAFVALRLDLLLIQYLLGVEQAGYYSVAVTLTDALYILPVTVGTILFPALSGMSDDFQRWHFSKKVVGIVGLLMAGIAIVASFGARPLINALYGPAFDPATAAFVWLLPGIVFLSVSSLLMNYLASVGMPPVVMYSSGTAAVANVGLNLKLIPSFGIEGASVSMSVSAGIMLAIVLFYIHRYRILAPAHQP
jgi:O-antigen/teichoic acid export membrane protein